MTAMTCPTTECARGGIVLDVDLAPPDLETGEPLTLTTVYCGGCSQPLTAPVVDEGEVL